MKKVFLAAMLLIGFAGISMAQTAPVTTTTKHTKTHTTHHHGKHHGHHHKMKATTK